jgi:hypothetical protein
MKSFLKSVGAVVSGFVSVAVLSVATDAALEAAGLFPSSSHPEAHTVTMLAIALAYRSVYTVLGGYITARLAPQAPEKHIVALMILGTIGGIAGIFAGWNLGNHWYPIAIAVSGPFLVWIGGTLGTKHA